MTPTLQDWFALAYEYATIYYKFLSYSQPLSSPHHTYQAIYQELFRLEQEALR